MFDSHTMVDPQAGLGLIRAHHRELSEDYRRAGHVQRRLGTHLRRLFAGARRRRLFRPSPQQVRSV